GRASLAGCSRSTRAWSGEPRNLEMSAVVAAVGGGTAFLGALGAVGTLGALATAAWGVYNPNSALFGPVIARGPRSDRSLYLTFDDGPNPSATARVLDLLERQGIPATFFLVGEHVRRFPDLAR